MFGEPESGEVMFFITSCSAELAELCRWMEVQMRRELHESVWKKTGRAGVQTKSRSLSLGIIRPYNAVSFPLPFLSILVPPAYRTEKLTDASISNHSPFFAITESHLDRPLSSMLEVGLSRLLPARPVQEAHVRVVARVRSSARSDPGADSSALSLFSF
jgi:hypothetical protein